MHISTDQLPTGEYFLGDERTVAQRGVLASLQTEAQSSTLLLQGNYGGRPSRVVLRSQFCGKENMKVTIQILSSEQVS